MDFESAYRRRVEGMFAEDLPGFRLARDFCLGEGKRVRPMLLLDAAAAWGGDMAMALDAAVAVELLHHYFLVHDDIMDRDLLRRGRPTLYAVCHEAYGPEKGEGIAIAVGDYLANEALALFSAAGPAVTALAFETVRGTINGQLAEYLTDPDWPLADIERFYASKTAQYTFALPWLVADALSPPQDRKERIMNASRHIGIAFQYRDDLEEFSGRKKRDDAGERDDFSRGKLTVVGRVLLDRLTEREQGEVRSQWKRGMSPDEARPWKQRADSLGVESAVTDMIETHLRSAEATLEELGIRRTDSVQAVLAFIGHPPQPARSQ